MPEGQARQAHAYQATWLLLPVLQSGSAPPVRIRNDTGARWPALDGRTSTATLIALDLWKTRGNAGACHDEARASNSERSRADRPLSCLSTQFVVPIGLFPRVDARRAEPRSRTRLGSQPRFEGVVVTNPTREAKDLARCATICRLLYVPLAFAFALEANQCRSFNVNMFLLST